MGICSPYVADSIGRISVYSSTTRPTSGVDFYVGKVIFEDDTARLMVCTSIAGAGTWQPLYDTTSTAYTPTLGNVTGGTTAGRYYRTGPLLWVHQQITVGTATGAAAVTLSLPAGYTSAAVIQPVTAYGPANTLVSAHVAASATAVSVYKTNAGGNWAGGDSLVNLRVIAVIEVA